MSCNQNLGNVAGDVNNFSYEQEAQMLASGELPVQQAEEAGFMGTGQTEAEFMEGLVEYLNASKPIQDALYREGKELGEALARSERTGIPIPVPQDSATGLEDCLSRLQVEPGEPSMAYLQNSLAGMHMDNAVVEDVQMDQLAEEVAQLGLQQRIQCEKIAQGGIFPVYGCHHCAQLSEPMQMMVEKLDGGVWDPNWNSDSDGLLASIVAHMQDCHNQQPLFESLQVSDL